MDQTPTIKGIFVNSHVKAVRNKLGEEGVKQLEQLFGKPLNFKNSENVLVKDEVKLIECVVRILEPNVEPADVPLEAGKLHFRNFSQTPFGRIIFSMFTDKLKLMMMQCQNIAGHVFNGVTFTSQDLGETKVKITMENNDYPLAHFKGLFEEWVKFSGKTGTVSAQKLGNGDYEYVLDWE